MHSQCRELTTTMACLVQCKLRSDDQENVLDGTTRRWYIDQKITHRQKKNTNENRTRNIKRKKKETKISNNVRFFPSTLKKEINHHDVTHKQEVN